MVVFIILMRIVFHKIWIPTMPCQIITATMNTPNDQYKAILALSSGCCLLSWIAGQATKKIHWLANMVYFPWARLSKSR